MKAFAVLGKDEYKIVDIEMPRPSDYEVLVKHEGCLFCNTTDQMIINNLFQTPDYPVILGHESFGPIVEVGPKVKNFKVGDYVMCSNAIPTGYNGKYYSTWGGFAEYGIAGDYQAIIEDGESTSGEFSYRERYEANYKMSGDFSVEETGLIFPLAETASCVMQVPEMLGKDVAVFGTGTVGYTLSMFSKSYGAKSVTVFGIEDERIRKALMFGADFAYHSDEAYKSEKKYDVVFEATGSYRVFTKGLPFLKDGGILAVYGVSQKPYEVDLGNVPVNFQYRKVDPQVGRAISFVEGLLYDRKIPVSEILTHVWQFGQMEEALNEVRKGNVIKGLVKFD